MARVIAMRSGEGERVAVGPSVTVVKVPGQATDGRLSVAELRFDAGFQGPPAHVHAMVDHVWWVVDGEVDLTVEQETERYSAGACLYVPAGTPHTFSTAATEGGTLLEVDTPRAFDDYFRDLGQVLAAGGDVDMEAVAEVMGRHDTTPAG